MLDDKSHLTIPKYSSAKSYLPNYSAVKRSDGEPAAAPSLDHDSSVSTQGSINLPTVGLKFTQNRKKTKKYARILMYIGYGQMIVDVLAFLVTILEMINAGGSRPRNV